MLLSRICTIVFKFNTEEGEVLKSATFSKKNIMTTIEASILAFKLYVIPPLICSIVKHCLNFPETFQCDIQFRVGYIASA